MFYLAKPIDLLAKYISVEDEDLSDEMHEPYTYLNVSIKNQIFLQLLFPQNVCAVMTLNDNY